MLENSVWKAYNEKSVHDVLVEYYKVESFEINEDDHELYTILKRDLTKKELKYFAMTSSGMSDAQVKETLHVEDEEFDKIVKKCAVKFRRNKLKEALRGNSNDS